MKCEVVGYVLFLCGEAGRVERDWGRSATSFDTHKNVVVSTHANDKTVSLLCGTKQYVR